MSSCFGTFWWEEKLRNHIQTYELAIIVRSRERGYRPPIPPPQNQRTMVAIYQSGLQINLVPQKLGFSPREAFKSPWGQCGCDIDIVIRTNQA